ncbi:unnamed protein product [Paramecium octaurelia]|uniref:non-specific serine/threonine protein kinase n=1 Tax=Paramecium octaurelia TaxID=43137 RepID=A0A8S1YG99_PAROT|nr:unnamed protein product [Paramecium octaurelia]
MSQQKNFITTDKGITYVIENMLGSGTGGQVYKAYRDEPTQVKAYVALKIQGNLEIQESQTLKTLSEHKLHHIVNILDLDSYNNYIVIIMDLATGSFQEFWKNERIVDIKLILHYFLQIVQGTEELHSLSLIHRDLKLDNVVYMEINNQKHLKLCDTGLMREKSGRKTITVGTPYYMAPEQINQNIYDEKIDIWALGMILYEMIAKKTMVDGNSIQSILQSILNLRQDQINQQIDSLFISNYEYSQDIKLLLKQMINVRSNERSKANVIVQKLKKILKIEEIQSSINGLQQSQFQQFQFNTSVYKEQIKQEIQQELEEKKNQEFKKLEEQYQKDLKQIREESDEQHQKQMRDEINKIRKEIEVDQKAKFEQELQLKEQQLQQEYQFQLTQVNEKQKQELTNKYDEDLLKQKKQMELQYQQKVDQQISLKQQFLIKEVEEKIRQEQQNKETELKKQLQEKLSHQYQQDFEQKLKDLSEFQNQFVITQQNILKSRSLIENQLKELKQQLQQQQMPSQNYSLCNQDFQKQLEDRLQQLMSVSYQIEKLNFIQQQNYDCNQIDENRKKLTAIINSSQQFLNPFVVDSFIKKLNQQLKSIAEEQTRLSLENEQQRLTAFFKDYQELIDQIDSMISKQQLMMQNLNVNADQLIQKDNQLQAEIQFVNQKFNEMRAEFKLHQSIMKNTSIREQTQTEKLNKSFMDLRDQFIEFGKKLDKAQIRVSQQKEKDLQLIMNDLQKLILQVNEWEQKINYNNDEQQTQFSNEEQEILLQLNTQLQNFVEIKTKIQSLRSQLKSNQIQYSNKIFTTIKTEFEISAFKIEQLYNNYIKMLNRLQALSLQQHQVITEHRNLKEKLRKHYQSLSQKYDHIANEYKDIQNVCKNEEKFESILLVIERQEKTLQNGYQERIVQINEEIADFEKKVFQNLGEVQQAESKISFKLEFISDHLRYELQQLNVIKQQATEQKDEYLEKNYQSFLRSLEELQTAQNSLQLTQTEQQYYDNIDNKQSLLQNSIKEYQQKLDEDEANTRLITSINITKYNYYALQQKIKNQIQQFQEKETFYKELVEKQKERISQIEEEVKAFNHDQIVGSVRNYLDKFKKITENIDSLNHESQNLDKEKKKAHINQFNNQIQIYREEIKELQKQKQENTVQFNNLQFYDIKIEIIKCFDFLFQQFCMHQREMRYYEYQQTQSNQNQQQKKNQDDNLKLHAICFGNLEICFNKYFSKNQSSQDQLLVQSVKKYLNENRSTNQQSVLELSLEMDLLKDLQEINKHLENQSKSLQEKVKKQNKVKLNAKIKLLSQAISNDQNKQFFLNIQQAFEYHIPKLKEINLAKWKKQPS